MCANICCLVVMLYWDENGKRGTRGWAEAGGRRYEENVLGMDHDWNEVSNPI